MSDSNDFSIKPITHGLGFHKKTRPIELKVKKENFIKTEMKAAPVSHKAKDPIQYEPIKNESVKPAPIKNDNIEETKKELSDLMSALDAITFKLDPDKNLDFVSEPAITDPIVAKKELTLNQRMNSSYSSTKPLGYMALDKIKPKKKFQDLNTSLPERNKPTHSIISTQEGIFKRPLIGVRRSAADNPPPVLRYKPISIHIAADLIDAFFIASVAVCFSFVLAKILEFMGQPISLFSFFTEPSFLTKVFALFVLSHQIYLVTTRVFFGKTIGEWTTDCQLGKVKQQKQYDYALRVVGRSLLLAITGFVTLPLLSLIFRKDLAGAISGLQLYQKDI